MEMPIASGILIRTSGIKIAHETPTSAAIKFPPITAFGCAIGLDGSTKTSSALAPKEAIAQSLIWVNSPINLARKATKVPPAIPPMIERQFSDQGTGF